MDGLKEYIREEIENLCFKRVEDEAPLLSSKLLDSITVVDLAVAIENETGMKIPFTEINEDNFDSIVKIIAYINTKK